MPICLLLALCLFLTPMLEQALVGSFLPQGSELSKMFVPLNVVDLVTNKLNYAVVELLVFLLEFNYASL